MFVHKYIRNEHLNYDTATIFGPLGKVSHIKLQKNGSDVLFVGGWSQFLVFNNISEVDILLFIYDGKMEFTVRVFDPQGYQRDYKHKETIAQLGEEKDKSGMVWYFFSIFCGVYLFNMLTFDLNVSSIYWVHVYFVLYIKYQHHQTLKSRSSSVQKKSRSSRKHHLLPFKRVARTLKAKSWWWKETERAYGPKLFTRLDHSCRWRRRSIPTPLRNL